jgi:hypothetical protein
MVESRKSVHPVAARAAITARKKRAVSAVKTIADWQRNLLQVECLNKWIWTYRFCVDEAGK